MAWRADRRARGGSGACAESARPQVGVFDSSPGSAVSRGRGWPVSWDSGLFFPRYGIFACALPGSPYREVTRPASSSSASTSQIRSASLSCTEPGSAPDTYRMSPLRAGDLQVYPCFLCLPE
jgi:hypothetical protein